MISKIFCFIVLFMGSFSFCQAGDIQEHFCYLAESYGYDGGYAGGAQEKREGHAYDPEFVYNQPMFQYFLESIKKELYLTPNEEIIYDRCFADGFFSGFRDGYLGRAKTHTMFSEEKDEKVVPIRSGKSEGALCNEDGVCWKIINGKIERIETKQNSDF